MQVYYVNPDTLTREYMIKGVNGDINSKEEYLSPRLTMEKKAGQPVILKEAVSPDDDSRLSGQFPVQNSWKIHEEKSRPDGRSRTRVKRVRVAALDTLSKGESNRLYARGLCARAVEEGIPEVEAYRGKEAEYRRSEPQAMIVCEKPNKPFYNSSEDSAFLREIYEAAEIIEQWTPIQRRVYLVGLREREKFQGRNVYRTVIRMMLTDSKGRKEFIRLFREGKL